ncbi:hypothetical protein JQM83_13445 [Parabacteroides distasonis]|nr:hypothetical protein [Parabacteroides distasonis]
MNLGVNYWTLSLVVLGTILVVKFVFYHVQDMRMRVPIALSAISIFIYSGYGIALDVVNDKYLYKYLIALFFFYLPFVLVLNKGTTRNSIRGQSMEKYLERHTGFLKGMSYIYLLLIIVPLIYPRFRMFDVFISGITIDGIYDYLNTAAGDPFSRFTAALALFIKPFFFAYITYLRITNPNCIKPYVLFLAEFMLGIMDSCYIGRSGMVYTALLLFFLVFCVKDGEFVITKKHILLILAVIVASIPFLYAYTFIRMGIETDIMSFSESLELLLASEATYPTYYDHISSSPVLQQAQSPISVILWLICLPIPSVLWPSKPTLANDVFTFSITGLHRTDYGYSSLLPSFLGESFMYFGGTFYWVFTFLVGMVFALTLKYLSQNRYMLIFMLLLAVRLTAAGRAGATAAIPSFVNGTIFVLLIDWFFTRIKKIY